MRVLIGICSVWVALATTVNAEPRRTTSAVTIRKQPGERQPAVGELAKNTEVEVLGEQGRWLLVRIGKLSGYVPRTLLTSGTTAPAPIPGKWSASRTHNGTVQRGLRVDATRASTLTARPAPVATHVSDVAEGARLVVIDATTDPAWIRVRDRAGREGWIARDVVRDRASVAVARGPEGARDVFVRTIPARRAIRADLGLGYRTLAMELTSNSDRGGLANYLVDADAIAATLDLDLVVRSGRRALFAADLRVQAGRSRPGIRYSGPTAPPGAIPFQTFAADVGVRAGIRLDQAIDLAARGGAHYDAFLVDDVDNPGALPRDRLLGFTLGARADLAPVRSQFAVSARADVLVVGSRAQTRGLEDGTSSTSSAVWAGVTIRYPLGRRFSLLGGYDFGRATTRWSGRSVRELGATTTRRVDGAQLVQVGISTHL
jgi:uncharacterized protein YgiM (DUF1202 family)